jgi:hypothetical protein
MNQDFKDLLQLFAKHEVEYLIVGGYAVIRYTQPRYTKDLDLWVRPTKENARRVAAALHEFGIPLIEVTEADLAAEGLQFMVGLPPCAADFLTTVPGLEFERAWSSRHISELDGIQLPYLSKPDLLASKAAAGRPQDLADIAELEASPPPTPSA